MSARIIKEEHEMKKAGRLSIAAGPDRFVLTAWPEGEAGAENSLYLPLNQEAAATLVAHLSDWLDASGSVRSLHIEFASDGTGAIARLHVAR
jgi:hypothetical protein